MLRRLHRWVAVPAAIFLISISFTGVVLQLQKLTGEDEKETLSKQPPSYQIDSSLESLGSKLAVAQANTKAKIGPAMLNSVELHLKNKPTFIFHALSGNEKKKITVNADTGFVEKIEKDEESFIMRLHSGEIFGDPGVVLNALWGLAWLFLTITGLIIYWQMRKKGRQGFGKVFWVLLILFLIAKPAMAGSPFLTDDPGFAPKGWEIKFESIYEHDRGQDILTAPVVDLNYTLVEHFKLNLTLAEKTLYPDEGDSRSGVADTDFKFKWRFLDEKPGEWWPAISMAPNVTFPTADKKKGLGDELWRFRLPLQFAKTFGKIYTYAEVGHQFVFDKETSDQFLYGYAIQYQLTDKLNIGAEINGNIPYDMSRTYTMIGNIGTSYTFNEHWQLQTSVGRTLREESNGGPKLLWQVFVQWNF